MIFVPGEFGEHDYVAMLDRVTAAMASPPEVVVVRGDAGRHTPYAVAARAGTERRRACRRWTPTPSA